MTEGKAGLTETEISVLLSDVRRAYALLTEAKPNLEKALEVCELSGEGLDTLLLDLRAAITDLEG